MKTQVLHYPRLDTVMMVEDAVRNAKDYPSKRQLWLSLKRKVMYQTFNLIIDYLEKSGKIMVNKRKIIWVWNPELIARVKKANLVIK